MTSQSVTSSRRRRGYPNGRDIAPVALAALRDLLGDERQTPSLKRRDLLIEHLHTLQDAHGHLSLVELRALAAYMNLPMAAVYETATFYAHFDVVHDQQAPPPDTTIRVCDSLSCQLAGASALHKALEARVDPDCVRVIRAPCMGRCDTAPVAEVGHHHVLYATADGVEAVVDTGHFHPEAILWQRLGDYQQMGGYQLLANARSGKVNIDEVLQTLETSGLRGLGGAGFPTFKKWQAVRQAAGPRYCVINADEGEPGTFKDRYYLERAPHQFLEGALVSAWAIEAEALYIYLRDEYPGLHRVLHEAIAELEQAGIVARGFILMRRGAGAYICGEESALIESLEGKPGKPRHRPPYVAQEGLFGRPTLVNNVETVYWIPAIWNKGAEWFTGHGRHGRRGLRSFSISGRVNKPGVYLAPAGITLRELVEEYAGGMAEGHTLAAYLPGGASGGILPASKADVPLDFDTLQAHGSFIGSAAIIVLSDQDNLQAVATNLLAFFADESCGQCTPCRVGSEKMLSLLEQPTWDVQALTRLAQVMQDASICGLGQAAPNPVLGLLKDFRPALAQQQIIVSDAAEGSAP
ncbi:MULTISPECIES: NADH-ubiquinone oxidoreductase-F iron-sulfur binding region domain-containing protein [unclassified Halomonas]|uniref:NADH-ubiquinone oxidoreductase-F iron-sulfur binding region domain-containing protein n=1 Tax=unclassified Halomonas TaxID=2609666 RepID=UPI001EF4051F|nr:MULTISPECIES: NADH-ubiquinone oxidoreductase-F iron-sulfur binding region domain-containing protein [unclassified Halomonas]MCG7576705.1 NAD(P)H-dependent oxidoreductase subunit E [Halomonas sp. MMH1-48]MCG7603768.1 NAD(P)H-dependent oxidoreductase subunit E [Halomonas sp. MM17-34]MCG7613018.1 NAD(P)H-dependent oxidoreductase subunit E [Halomonas sp. MM17-29]MCG7619694.1 NAD(P)H-dependent oxidoreductase subunit E [Halomonas sp. DSH1-27]